jgi:ribonucleoside-diphosphate reductase alpha chain
VKYKLLAGGGMLKIVNRTVPDALLSLGYGDKEVSAIIGHIEKYDTIEDMPLAKDDALVKAGRAKEGDLARSGLKPEHIGVFDCAFRPARGQRSIHYMAHLKMMAAAQPFISGAISKTVNMPHDAKVEEIRHTYAEAWKMGLKCVAIYRDGSKRSQPLNTKRTSDGTPAASADNAVETRIGELETEVLRLAKEAGKPLRRRLPETRQAVTHKFDIASHEGYLTVGVFDDGQPGELFITMAKEGSTIGGLMDAIGTLTSMALQFGVPLETLVRKFAHQRFEPSGFTKNPEIRSASSITDYVFRWMAHQFIAGYKDAVRNGIQQPDLNMPGLPEAEAATVNRPVALLARTGEPGPYPKPIFGQSSASPSKVAATLNGIIIGQQDAPACPVCGQITVRNGACYKCVNCGESLGCS